MSLHRTFQTSRAAQLKSALGTKADVIDVSVMLKPFKLVCDYFPIA